MDGHEDDAGEDKDGGDVDGDEDEEDGDVETVWGGEREVCVEGFGRAVFLRF